MSLGCPTLRRGFSRGERRAGVKGLAEFWLRGRERVRMQAGLRASHLGQLSRFLCRWSGLRFSTTKTWIPATLTQHSAYPGVLLLLLVGVCSGDGELVSTSSSAPDGRVAQQWGKRGSS